MQQRYRKVRSEKPSAHPLKVQWEKVRKHKTPNLDPEFSSDCFRDGFDYLTLVSTPDFETFVRQQLSNDEIRERVGFSTVLEWLTASSSNNRSSAMRLEDHALNRTIKFPVFIDKLRKNIWDSLAKRLSAAYRAGGLPIAGTLLHFTDNLTYCYLISYHMRYERPVVEIIDRIKSPKGVFEIENILKLRSPRAKNSAKNLLTSGHKIVMQQGVLTHVDRRADRNVFGPTIDTLLLADILRKDATANSSIESFLEIGSGSGHISATAAIFYEKLRHFIAVDISEFAASCTTRHVQSNLKYFQNLETNGYEVTAATYEQFYSACGAFKSNIIRGKFDLVVSNPPYIPRPPHAVERFGDRHADSVAGTELLESIVSQADNLLNPKGRMLVMVSSVTGKIVDKCLPRGFRTKPALPQNKMVLEVPFEVEEVLDNRKWISELVTARQVINRSRRYWHDLVPTWILRK